ncbi:hypothetical protein Athai_29290 [Actinocatenispora thailandica]|uniref:Uncharacterized protein n=2 Tax=Actinocatenispora thailandica TaxID=227318 RepID=A0A7R7DPM3_9ACTN|nr:hypothetical protein Athai_29290 [Actinocatenispora thailandica]
MADVVWLGGGCGAGKSTLARRLAYRYDLRLWPVDAYSYAHQRRATTEPGWPVMRAAAGLDFAARWLSGSVDDQLVRFLGYAAEQFTMVADDLAALPDRTLTLVEGPQLLPAQVAASGGAAMWLLPTPRQVHRSRRQRRFAGLADQATLDRVLGTLIDRDVLLAEHLRRQVGAIGGYLVDVDVDTDWDRLADVVAGRLGLRATPPPPDRNADGVPRAGAAGGVSRVGAPDGVSRAGAADGAARQRLRRAENAAVLANLTAHRAWTGTTTPLRGPFACECTRLGCAAQTSLDIDDYRARTGPLVLCADRGGV